MRTPRAEVRQAGVATIQDGGRRGFSHLGVPVSGAFHRARYRTAVALLLGFPDDRAPAIEVLAGTLALDVLESSAVVVVGPADVLIDGGRAPGGTVIEAPAGSRLTVLLRGPGPAYVMLDGWQPAATLGSVATDTFSGLGGAQLQRGHVLHGEASRGHAARVGAFQRRQEDRSGPVRVIAAGGGASDALVTAGWSVAAASRSGVRLTGGALPVGASIASMPVLPGAVQATPGGEAIVLGPDGGLTGGYPVVGVVATVDLDRISLLAPGDRVTFEAIEVEQAVHAFAESERVLRRSLAHPGQLA